MTKVGRHVDAEIPVAAPEQVNVREMLRPAVFIPESKPLNVLLKEFRKNRNHIAIVVDEYGGVAGLVTIEDVLEPFLIQRGLIQRTPRGRLLTGHAFRHLGLAFRPGTATQFCRRPRDIHREGMDRHASCESAHLDGRAARGELQVDSP